MRRCSTLPSLSCCCPLCSYYDPKTKKLITDRARIKREYIKSWFLLDFFSVVPADQALFVIGTLLLACECSCIATVSIETPGQR